MSGSNTASVYCSYRREIRLEAKVLRMTHRELGSKIDSSKSRLFVN